MANDTTNNPFAKLSTVKLDTSLTRETRQQPEPFAENQTTENPQTRKSANPQDGKPAYGLEEKPPSEQPEKYTTRLEPSMIKQVKVFAAQHELKDYEVVKQALIEYFERHP